MLQNAYLLAKIGADTAENEQHFAEKLPKIGNYPTAAVPGLFATFDAIDSDIEDTEFAADAVRSGEACAVGCSARESTIQ